LTDAMFSDSMVYFTIGLCFLGVGIGLLTERLIRQGRVPFFVLSLLSLIVLTLGQAVPLIIFSGESSFFVGRTAIFQILYTLVFCLPLFAIGKRLGRKNEKI